MNRFSLLTFSLLLAACSANAQTSQVKNVAKSTFRLTAYDASGSETSTTCGVFTSANGEAVGSWSALASAARAVVTDFNGNTYPVKAIIGANDLYDVCRFKVDVSKTVAAPLAKTAVPKGGKLWLVGQQAKSQVAVPFEVERKETFGDNYNYYVFAYNDKAGMPGSAFVTLNGEVAGLLKRSTTSLDTHAVDARFVTSLAFGAMDINNPLYSKSGIRMQLPSDKKQAQIMVMLSADLADSTKYSGYISDYVALFPHDVDGYSMSALRKSSEGDYAGADADMQTALRQADNKAEAHAEYSRVMYQKLVYSDDSLYTAWTFDRALDESEKAYKIDPQPAYRHRIGQILFSKREYVKACDVFVELSKSAMPNSEVFFEIAQCKSQLGSPREEILAQLDSAVAHCRKPYSQADAPYILSRGQFRDAMNNYRGALADYNVYDTLMVGRASADFYYTRYKCEVNLRQFQPALNDIAHAAYIAGHDMQPVYLAEMASLQLRVNHLDDAIRTSDMCLSALPENTDALIIKGVALARQGKKKDALDCLQRAKALGDARGDEYIKKYCK